VTASSFRRPRSARPGVWTPAYASPPGPRRNRQRTAPGDQPAATTTNHYGGDGDSPDWTSASNGISRSLEDAAGNLTATTSATGDIATQIPLVDSTTPVVNTYDEYGYLLPGTDPARYGWLGGKQRSTETPSAMTLMGVRLYDPSIGRSCLSTPSRAATPTPTTMSTATR
jgi:hypothetical protein